ncbi:MAG: YcjF family protein [Opitutales bacterium]|nr:YcjF family protein [Opitutales bacterium]
MSTDSKTKTEASRVAAREDDTGHNNPSRPPKKVQSYEAPKSPPKDSGAADSGTEPLRSASRGFGKLLFFSVGLAAAAALVLYLLLLDFLFRMHELPLFLQVPGWALLALVSGFVLWALFQTLRFWFSLRSFSQVRVPKPHPRPDGSSADDAAEWEQSRKVLSKYLKYMTSNRALQERWLELWPEEAEIRMAEVLSRAERLQEPRSLDTPSWIRELDQQVLGPLDRIADARIRSYAKRVGVKTAISPFPLVDALAVLYNAFLLIQDLAALYGRRLNRYETLFLLGLITFQVYVAGETQELTEAGMSEVHGIVSGGVTNLTSRISAFVSPKLAEGVLNAFVLYRLGRYAKRRFKPLSNA